MNTTQATKLANTLQRQATHHGLKLSARVELRTGRVARRQGDGRMAWVNQEEATIVFQGGSHGEHSLDAGCSSRSRVLAHWAGYCEANGMPTLAVGQRVEFPSASAHRSGGYRTARIVRVGLTRVTLFFHYKHSGKATAIVPISKIRGNRWAE